jgi:hypothetical protein
MSVGCVVVVFGVHGVSCYAASTRRERSTILLKVSA